MPDPDERQALIDQLLGPPDGDESSWPRWSPLTRAELPVEHGAIRSDLDVARADMADILRGRLPSESAIVGDHFTFYDLAYIASIAVYAIEPDRQRLARLRRPATWGDEHVEQRRVRNHLDDRTRAGRSAEGEREDREAADSGRTDPRYQGGPPIARHGQGIRSVHRGRVPPTMSERQILEAELRRIVREEVEAVLTEFLKRRDDG